MSVLVQISCNLNEQDMTPSLMAIHLGLRHRSLWEERMFMRMGRRIWQPDIRYAFLLELGSTMLS